MRMEGLAFPEAVRRLGEKAGVEVPDEQMTPAEEQRRQERDKLARINEVAAEFYHQLLLDGEDAAPARRYLRQRGFDAEAVRFFQLGYAPEQWDGLSSHLKGKGFESKAVRDQLGLTRSGKEGRDDYDLFRKRLMIPIIDIHDHVVAFGGRVLDDSLPKYINSPESPIYHKSRILYGLYGAREAMRRENAGIVVEGYFDQMALHRAGFENSVATCGTALTPEHVKLLKRYTDRLLLLFDQDKAGRQAILRAMEVLLPAGFSVAVVTLKEGADPDSFLVDHGSEAMQARLEAAQPVLEYYIELTLAQSGDSVEGRSRAVEAIAGKLSLLKSDIEKDLYIKSVSERTGLDASLLRNRSVTAQSPGSRAGSTPVRAPVSAPPEKTVLKVPDAVVKAQKNMLRLLIDQTVSPTDVDLESLEELFPDEGCRAIAELIITLIKAGQEVDSGRMHAKLDPASMELLATIESGGSEYLIEDPEDIFTGCRTTTKKYFYKLQSDKLKELLDQAQQDGDSSRESALQKEYFDLKKYEKKL